MEAEQVAEGAIGDNGLAASFEGELGDEHPAVRRPVSAEAVRMPFPSPLRGNLAGAILLNRTIVRLDGLMRGLDMRCGHGRTASRE